MLQRIQAFKQARVRMEVISVEGENPLPKTSPRNATRTPQMGLEVFRKWDSKYFANGKGMIIRQFQQ